LQQKLKQTVIKKFVETFRNYSPISVELFCKNSQVAFMPYGVGLKDERPTLNIERPTSNEKTNIQYRNLTPISVSFQPFDSAQGREPVERPF
jgi:hypothetical protein